MGSGCRSYHSYKEGDWSAVVTEADSPGTTQSARSQLWDLEHLTSLRKLENLKPPNDCQTTNYYVITTAICSASGSSKG